MEEVKKIPISQIYVSPDFNVRLTDRDKGIVELAESIKEHGQLQPIMLMSGRPPYKIVLGQRRFLAHKYLKKDTILAIFHKTEDRYEATILSLAENMHRQDLNHADKAKAITFLYNHFHKNIKRVSKQLGLPTSTIRDYIEIEAQMTPKAEKLLKLRKLSKVDFKRVIKASQGDKQKADVLLDNIAKLTKYDKIRMADIGSKNPNSSASKIIQEAKIAKIEPIVMVNLTKELNEALVKAERHLSIEREEIAVKALSEWLYTNGYLKNDRG